MLVCSIASDTLAGVEFRSKPIYSRKSALPQKPEKDLFPCFATLLPAEDATIAAAVLILNDLIVSPPVPHVSIKFPLTLGVIFTACSFTVRRIVQISSA